MAVYPLISVIVCTYNGEKYLREQLDSILNQTYSNIELIIVDDCSTDSTWNIINDYLKHYPKIIVKKNNINLGYIKNFEGAMHLAKGEFIALSDQDDIWDLRKLEILQKHIEEHSMIYSDSEMIDEQGASLDKKMSDIKFLSDINNPAILMTDNCIAGHATLFTKELFINAQPFPIHIPHDWWLAFIATLYNKIIYIGRPLVNYRQHADNVIGSVRIKERVRKKKINESEKIKTRLNLFYDIITDDKNESKILLKKLIDSYQSFSFQNNINRVSLFLQNRKTLLFIKKRSSIRKFLFCIKMFVKIK